MQGLHHACKGCNVTDFNYGDCFTCPEYTDEHNKTYECPCINCLVKSMCKELCNDHLYYKRRYWATLQSRRFIRAKDGILR